MKSNLKKAIRITKAKYRYLERFIGSDNLKFWHKVHLFVTCDKCAFCQLVVEKGELPNIYACENCPIYALNSKICSGLSSKLKTKPKKTINKIFEILEKLENQIAK